MARFLCIVILASFFDISISHKVCNVKTTTENPLVESKGTKITEATTIKKETTTKHATQEIKRTSSTKMMTSTEVTTTETPDCAEKDTFKKFNDTLVEFSFKYLEEAKKQAEYPLSVVTSPSANLLVLAVLSLHISVSPLYKKILKFLNLENDSEVRCAADEYRNSILINSLQGSLITSSIFVSPSFNVTDVFRKEVYKYLDARIIRINFAQPIEAKNKMNEMGKMRSKGLIPDLFDATEINSETQFVISTTAVFKIAFKFRFDEKTTKMPFYKSSTKYNILETYHKREICNYTYSSKLEAKVLSCPLKYPSSEYLAIVPDEIKGITRILRRLENTPEIIQEIVSSFTPAIVDIYIPKYDNFCTKTDVKEVIQKSANIDAIFKPRDSKFINVVEGNKPFAISIFRQGACTTYDNSGVAPVVDQDNLQSVTFKVDRVSLFLIYAKNVISGINILGLN